MIKTKFGSEVTIVQYCGKHRVLPDFPEPIILVKVRRINDNKEMFRFSHTLKADGGLKEIDKAIDAAEEVIPTGRALKEALREAE